MITRRLRRTARAIAIVVTATVLSACTGLPTTGDVTVVERGQAPEDPDFLPLASDPVPGAGPAEIVEGFIEAGITPADGWQTARKFLTPELAAAWRPGAGVAIDASATSRAVVSTVEEDDDDAEDATEADVRVQTELVASVDETGVYVEAPGTGDLPFRLERNAEGEWRIAEAPDGIVIDENRFPVVFDGYPLNYFDQSWKRLVPDVRWFPRRAAIATPIVQALIGGAPSPWLEPSVQSAFPPDVRLALDAVPIDADQVAEVALNRAALGLDQTTLARMRTQLQQTLIDAGVRVSQVRFSVDGRRLDAGVVEFEQSPVTTGSMVLRDGVFGTIVGDDIVPIPGISDGILTMPQSIAAIDVSADETSAAVQQAAGGVFIVGGGRVDELDGRPGLVRPSIDRYGYTWSVPATDPRALIAWSSEVTEHPVANAWPEASSVSHIRVAADGARIAAVVSVGGQRWAVAAAVIRDDNGMPVELGEMNPLGRIQGDATGLVWLGPDRLGILTELDGPMLMSQLVGGPATIEAAPADARSIAGARSMAGVRMLGADGALFVRSGSAWREAASGVSVLATRSGQ